jgi:hypothetical protein
MTTRRWDADVPAKIDSLEDAASWIHAHDGRIDAWWDMQHALNKDNASRFTSLEKRMQSVEYRVIWAAGLAAGFGATISGGLMKLFGGPA